MVTDTAFLVYYLAFIVFVVLLAFWIAFLVRAWRLMGRAEKYLDAKEKEALKAEAPGQAF